jgi:hypothetical protein
MEAVEVLLEAGADVHIVCKTNATAAGVTPIYKQQRPSCEKKIKQT